MGKQFASIETQHRDFILRQPIFFTASAARDGRVNVSPKDGAALRILNDRRVAWLDVTGSGNETAAHLRANGRLTVMFCAFEGSPVILRLYGRGRVLLRESAEYRDLLSSAFQNQERPGARQIIVLDVEMVQTSCGFGVPLFSYMGERTNLDQWAAGKGEDGLREYWQMKNSVSMDGLPTGILQPAEEPISR
jgi:predicted pyridoxine 5'-phosphate oxidase superfamily flavin-nucleotide-binding protein